MNTSRPLDIHNCECGTISSRRDGSVRFYIDTPELLASQRGELMGMHGKAVRCLIAPHECAEAPIEVTTERGQKTPGQRLRAVLFLLWRQQQSAKTFDVFYAESMEIQIDKIKQQLD